MRGDFDGTRARTIADALYARALTTPDEPVFVFRSDDGVSRTSTYRSLDVGARRLMAWLVERRLTGERVALALPPGLDYIEALFGCFYAGAIAVPAYPPTRDATDVFQSIVADAGAAAVICPSAASAGRLSSVLSSAGRNVACCALDAMAPGDVRLDLKPSAEPSGLAYLQYTSGSTGTPNGVRVSHANLIENLRYIHTATGARTDHTQVSWLPPYHDLGLVVSIFMPVFQGHRCVLMTPRSFVRRPRRWLEAITEHRATASGAPNFAYDMCVRAVPPEARVGLDLTSWSIAFNGAETVRADVLQRFVDAFAPCGFRADAFRPGYGLAEATLLVSLSAGGGPLVISADSTALGERRIVETAADAPGSRTLVGCGTVVAPQSMAIVDPETGVPCGADQVGEIWVAGPSVSDGYWKNTELTSLIFDVPLRGAEERSSGTYLRTGDLGFVHRGELFVTGRLKDLLVARGRNHHPEDIERTVESCHPAVGFGRSIAFAVEDGEAETGAVAIELERGTAEASTAEIASAVRAGVSARHGLTLSLVVFLRPGGLPRTTSGKPRRRACRELFLSGNLDVIDVQRIGGQAGSPPPPIDPATEQPTLDDIRKWLIENIARQGGLDPRTVDTRRPMASYGLDSVAAVSLSSSLGAYLGREVSPLVAYEHPTIDACARFLATGVRNADRAVSAPASHEPIAIIGMSCRFPQAGNPVEFWRLLRSGRDAITDAQGARFDRTYPPGGYLDDVAGFDASFFGISSREAMSIDPQQRILLELAWESLEDAGIAPTGLAGRRVGVFVGISNNDYGALLRGRGLDVDPYSVTGNSLSIAANRISYALDLRGPSVAVDTACSSSLLATHLACASILRGECELALVGGANLILLSDVSTSFKLAGALSPDGRCRPFAAAANGIGRSEGAGVIVLKPLSRAVQDRDYVYACIVGSAVNQDGATNGIVAPSAAAQQQLLRDAYSSAGILPSEVQFVEAHGTGTPLGDPVEASALNAVLASGRSAGQPCLIGSVKSNIGHLEAAAGIAGLIKTALAVAHGELPPTIHFDRPNPLIPFHEWPIRVQDALSPWPGDGTRVAGVSGFGFGGTNAHVVLRSGPARDPGTDIAPPFVLPISARSAGALRSLADAFRAQIGELNADDHAALGRICAAAAQRRAHHDYRVAVTAPSAQGMVQRLEALLSGEASPGLYPGPAVPRPGRPVIFVFSGYGGQWRGMGRMLMRRCAVFDRAVRESDALMCAHHRPSVLPFIENTSAESGSEGETLETAQRALFSVQIGLTALWQSWGITPAGVVGHSAGEVAAAYAAGALGLEDAARICAVRARLLGQLIDRPAATGQTGMLSVSISPAEMRDRLTSRAAADAPVWVASHNGPRTVVMTGALEALTELSRALAADGVESNLLRAPGAGHSPYVSEAAEALIENLHGLAPRSGRVPLYSTVTGGRLDGKALDAGYWGRNLREPVLFIDAVGAIAGAEHHSFIELNSHPILSPSLVERFESVSTPPLVLPVIRLGEKAPTLLLRALAALYADGHEVDWGSVHGGTADHAALPRYPWQHQRFWPSDDGRVARRIPASHGRSILGDRLDAATPSGERFWESRIDRDHLHGLHTFVSGNAVVVAAASFLEAAVEAATAVVPGSGQGWRLSNIQVPWPLIFHGSERVLLQTLLAPVSPSRFRFQIASRFVDGSDSRDEWRSHADGEIERIETGPEHGDGEQITPPADVLDGAAMYRRLDSHGMSYDETARELMRASVDGDSASAVIATKGGSVLAATLHVLGSFAAAPGQSTYAGVFDLPSAVSSVLCFPATSRSLRVEARVTASKASRERLSADLRVTDQEGRVVVKFEGYEYRRHSGPALSLPQDPRSWLYGIEWRRQESVPPPGDGPRAQVSAQWIVLHDGSATADALCRLAAAAGVECTSVFPGELFQALGPGRFEVRPGGAADWRELFRAVVRDGRPPCTAVLHLWTADSGIEEDCSLSRVKEVQQRGCVSALALIKELAATGFDPPIRLWLVTRGAQPIQPGATANPLQAPLWGFGRSLSIEWPENWGGLIDIDSLDRSEDAARAVCAEVLSGDPENQVAYANGQRHVPRLAHLHLPDRSGDPPIWRPDGTYLLTGAFGRIGPSIARWLVAQGARRIVLAGRTRLPPRHLWPDVEENTPIGRRIGVVRDLEARGAVVETPAVDVGDELEIAAVLDRVRDRFPPIRGVFHAAGIFELRTIDELTTDRMEEILRAKVEGAWLLHRLLAGTELDHFVLFSSFSSVLTLPFVTHYAAANAFLDALVHYRRARGLPGSTINWGLWGEAGARSHPMLPALETLSPTEALDALRAILTAGLPQVSVARIDWTRDLDPRVWKIPFFAELRLEADRHRAAASAGVPVRSTLKAAALVSADAARLPMITQFMQTEIAKALGVDAIAPDQALTHWSIDSLIAIELKRQFERELDVTFPAVAFVSGPTINQLAAYVLQAWNTGEAH